MTDLGDFDLAVVGGGVNGAGIARDAAGRGLSVLLVEKDDLRKGRRRAPASSSTGAYAISSTMSSGWSAKR